MKRFLHQLLGKRLIGLARVTLTDDVGIEPLTFDGTLVLDLGESGRYELYTHNAHLMPLYDLTEDKRLRAGFRLEKGEKLSLTGVEFPETLVRLGCVMDSVTEVWARGGKGRYLLGATLWDKDRHPVMTIETDTDDVLVVPADTFSMWATEMPFYERVVQFHWYRA